MKAPEFAIGFLVAVALALLQIAVVFVAVFASTLFMSCTKPDGPSSAERQVIGRWAGTTEAGGLRLLLELDIREAKDYRADMAIEGKPATSEAGKWFLRGRHIHTVPAQCFAADQLGGPLRPIACGPPDSVLVNIQGVTWTLNFTQGGDLFTFQMVRVL